MNDDRQSDTQWIRAAVSRFQRPLTAYCLKLTGSLELAREITQDAFLKLCDQPRQRVEGHLAPWLYTVCRNRALDVLRKESRGGPMAPESLAARPDGQPGPDQQAERRELAGRMLDELEKLPAAQQEALRLRFHAAMSYRQIAEVMDITVGYVGWLIHTGLATLRHRMDKPRREAM